MLDLAPPIPPPLPTHSHTFSHHLNPPPRPTTTFSALSLSATIRWLRRKKGKRDLKGFSAINYTLFFFLFLFSSLLLFPLQQRPLFAKKGGGGKEEKIRKIASWPENVFLYFILLAVPLLSPFSSLIFRRKEKQHQKL